MKRTKIILVGALVLLMLTANIFNVFSYDKTSLPQYIKIGLFFDTTAKSSLPLESKTGFEVGIFNENEFTNLFNIDDNKIILQQDRPYINGNTSINGLSNTEDYYHVQIGEGFIDYEGASDFIDTIKIDNTKVYLSYEKEWRIYAGPYLNEFEAKEEAKNINMDYGYETNIVTPSNTRVQVTNQQGDIIFIYDSSDEIYFLGQNSRDSIPLVDVEGTEYRGGITAKRLASSDMTIINRLPLDQYLYGVIPSEMPALWPIEALKAQAIAARGFAITNYNKYSRFDFNLCTTTFSQVYKGYSGEHPNANRAVDETKDIIITYGGRLVEPYYHADSGGYTENSENVWTNPLPYIRGVKDDFSLDTPYSPWSVTLARDEIKDRLANNNIFIGDILDIEIISRSDSGRVLSLIVHGTEGQETLLKERSRLVFGLKSNLFTINSSRDDNNKTEDDTSTNNDNIADSPGELFALDGVSLRINPINLKGKHIVSSSGINEIENIGEISIYNGKQYKNINIEPAKGPDKEEVREPREDTGPPDVFTFEGRGYGHGLGMSQYGARKMAELGYKYDEILTHYYRGVKVE